MTDKPLISIVMGSYNRLEFLKLAIDSARQETADIPHEIIVVDGGSDDGSLEWLIWQKDIITIVQHNRGEWNSKPIPRRSWGYFMNLAFKSAQAEYILMMSDDTIFHPHAVKNALTFIEQQLAQGKRVGAVPFYFHDVIGEPEHRYKVGVLFGLTFLNHGIYRKSALEAVGYADETTYTFYAADVDLSYK
ncbi:MAG: family 2 glycosyl transferase, partial [Phototrophicales bacterium]